MTDTALRDRIAGVLDEHRRKPSRVQANLVLQLIDGTATTTPEPTLPLVGESPRWRRYSEANAAVLARAVAQGDATTRNRTDAAIRALGLEPHEVRAVVIERDLIRVFKITDRGERIGAGLPIIEEETA